MKSKLMAEKDTLILVGLEDVVFQGEDVGERISDDLVQFLLAVRYQGLLPLLQFEGLGELVLGFFLILVMESYFILNVKVFHTLENQVNVGNDLEKVRFKRNRPIRKPRDYLSDPIA